MAEITAQMVNDFRKETGLGLMECKTLLKEADGDPKKAKELAMLCRRYTAAQALEMGLVNAVVEDADLESEVAAWCEEIAALSPRYLEITKISSNIWWNAARDSFSTGLGMLMQAVGSADMVEGASAFLAKRRPSFPDPA